MHILEPHNSDTFDVTELVVGKSFAAEVVDIVIDSEFEWHQIAYFI